MQEFLQITRALGDVTRVRALMALRNRELCLCQLIDLLGLAPSTVSKHLTVLHQAGLVQRRKEGRWHFYRHVGSSASPVVRHALDWVVASLETQPIITDDERALSAVCNKELEELSACYRT